MFSSAPCSRTPSIYVLPSENLNECKEEITGNFTVSFDKIMAQCLLFYVMPFKTLSPKVEWVIKKEPPRLPL
jgi:hypothetical protein